MYNYFMIEKDLKFDTRKTHRCIMCNAEIQVKVFHTEDKIWTELESKYWTPELKPLCSCLCGVNYKDGIDNGRGSGNNKRP